MTTTWYGETAAAGGAHAVNPLRFGEGTLRRATPRMLPVYGLCVQTTDSGPALKARPTG
jgi:hypothetical protein